MMNVLIIVASVIGWAVWRRAFGGWWFWSGSAIAGFRIGSRAPLVALCFLAVFLPFAYLWSPLAASIAGVSVCLYWAADHEPEGPTWWSVMRYLGPVGLSWALARKVWRNWMYRPPLIDCAGTLGEWIAGGIFGLIFGVALAALI